MVTTDRPHPDHDDALGGIGDAQSRQRILRLRDAAMVSLERAVAAGHVDASLYVLRQTGGLLADVTLTGADEVDQLLASITRQDRLAAAIASGEAQRRFGPVTGTNDTEDDDGHA